MIFQRWYRELGGLAAFLVILYAAVTWTNRSMEADGSADVNASQMTKARLYSDSAMRRANLEDASIHLKDLLVADPHNSHARFRLAECYNKQFTDTYSRLYKSRSDRDVDPMQVKAIRLRLRQLGDQAVELYERSTKSHRYRGESLYKLSVLSGLRDDREKTLSSLERFLALNYSTYSGIAQLPEFSFLLNDPEFQRLILVEQDVKRRKLRRHSRSRGGSRLD